MTVKSAAVNTSTTTQMFRSILLVVMVGASLVAATDGDVESELQLLGTLATKLQLAATYGDLEGLRILLAAGAPVDETVDLNVTPLHLAARKGHTEVVEALVVAGASLSARDEDGDTPLHIAAVYGKEDAVASLCAAGASHKALNKFGSTPLHVAASNGEADAIRILVAAGAALEATTNRNKATPLHAAAGKGFVEAIEALLAAGASLEARTSAGATPMALALENGHVEAQLTLRSHWAVPSQRVGTSSLAAAPDGNVASKFPSLATKLRSWLPATQQSRSTQSATYAADLTLVIVVVAVFRLVFVLGEDCSPHHVSAGVTIFISSVIAVSAFFIVSLVTPFDTRTMLAAAMNRLFFDADLTTATTTAAAIAMAAAIISELSIYGFLIAASKSEVISQAWALFGRAPARAAAAKRRKSRGSATTTNELRREMGAARKAAVAAEQQAKREASEREKVASRIAITESKEAAQKAQTAARESDPASKAAGPRAVAAPNQPEDTAAAQRLADEHASEIEAAQLHKALEDSAREARELAELTAIEAHELAVCMEVSPSPEVESRESGGRGRRKDRGGRGGRGGPGGRGGRGQVYKRDSTAPSSGAVAEASADLATRLGLAAAPPTPGGIAPTLSNESVPVEEEQAATVTAPAAAPLSVAADVPGPAQPSSSAPDAERTCVVCLHGPQSHVALPCGHLIYCGGCAALMRGKPCAFCMNEVSEIKEVFRG